MQQETFSLARRVSLKAIYKNRIKKKTTEELINHRVSAYSFFKCFSSDHAYGKKASVSNKLLEHCIKYKQEDGHT